MYEPDAPKYFLRKAGQFVSADFPRADEVPSVIFLHPRRNSVNLTVKSFTPHLPVKLNYYLSTIAFIGLAFAGCRPDDDLSRLPPCERVKPVIVVEQDGLDLTAVVMSGAEPFEFLWNTGAETATISDVPTGLYTVFVRDANGCTAEAEGIFENPCDDHTLRVRITTDANAAGAVVSGGEPPYSYQWSTGDTGASITDLAPGIYSLKVTDGTGCSASSSAVVRTGCGGEVAVTDGEGHMYPVVEIGGHCWMAENLRTAVYANGDSLQYIPIANNWGLPTEGVNFANDPNGDSPPRYGHVYNFYAVTDPRKLCPQGWRVPDRKDWNTLFQNAGEEEVAGILLNAETGWPDAGIENTDPSGFGALPGGHYDVFFGFEHRGEEAHFWTEELGSAGFGAMSVVWSNQPGDIRWEEAARNRGKAVRCIRE